MTIPWSQSLYRVTIGGTNVSDRISPHLLSLSVVDKDKAEADTATITLDDYDARFVLPEKGTSVRIELGAVGRGLVKRFEGVVDSVSWRLDRGGGSTIEISAKSLDPTTKAKEPMSRHWDDAELHTVLKQASVPAGFQMVMTHVDIAFIRRPYWHQDNESFIAFAQRIAREVGAVFKVRDRIAMMGPKNASFAATGAALKPITVSPAVNLISANITPFSTLPQFKRVKTRYYDRAKSKWVEKEVEVKTTDDAVTAGQSLVFTRPDEGQASAAGKAESADVERDKGGGSVDIDGDPTAVAGAICILSGCRPGVDGEYKIASVTDKLDRGSGYITTLELVRPDADAGKDKRAAKKKAAKAKAAEADPA